MWKSIYIFLCFLLKNYSPHIFFLQVSFLVLTIPIVWHIRTRSLSWCILLVVCLWWLHISLTFLSCQSSGTLKPFSVLYPHTWACYEICWWFDCPFFPLMLALISRIVKDSVLWNPCFLHSTYSSVVSVHCDLQGRSVLFQHPGNSCIAEKWRWFFSKTLHKIELKTKVPPLSINWDLSLQSQPVYYYLLALLLTSSVIWTKLLTFLPLFPYL